MRFRFLLVPLVAVGALAAGRIDRPASAAPPVPRMFPQFVMLRGGNLERPLTIGHSNLRHVVINGRGANDVSLDPLAQLYGTLEHTKRGVPDSGDVVRKFEVAEYFGPPWSSLSGPDGMPTRPIRFEEANHFSTIYVMRVGPPLWKDPVVAPGGGDYSMLVLGDTGQAILSRQGLKLR